MHGGLGGARGAAARPRGVMCYICGREYGTASIDIHLKSCKKKWEIQEEQKPRRERRPCPEEPPSFAAIKGGQMSQ